MSTELNKALPGPSAQSSASMKRAWLVAILGSLAMMGPLTIDMYLPALPTIVTDFHTTASQVQLSLTFYLLGMCAGQLFAGPISDMRGRRVVMLTGLTVYTVMSILCALSPTIWMLIVFRSVQGFAGAAGIVVSRAVVRDLYEGSELTKFFTLLMMVNGAGPIVAPIIGGQLLRVATWHAVFWVLCGVGIVMFLAVFFGLKETLPQAGRSKGGVTRVFTTFRGLLGDRVFMGYAMSQGCVTAALFAYLSGSSFVLQDIYGVSPQTYSYIFAVNGIGFIISSQITGRLVDRIGEMRLLISGYFVAAAGGVTLLVMLLLGAGLPGILPCFFLIVSSVGIVGPTSSSLALQSQGKAAGSAAGLLGVLSLMFGAFSSPLVGLGGGESATPFGVVLAAASAGSVLCWLLLIRPAAKRNRQ